MVVDAFPQDGAYASGVQWPRHPRRHDNTDCQHVLVMDGTTSAFQNQRCDGINGNGSCSGGGGGGCGCGCGGGSSNATGFSSLTTNSAAAAKANSASGCNSKSTGKDGCDFDEHTHTTSFGISADDPSKSKAVFVCVYDPSGKQQVHVRGGPYEEEDGLGGLGAASGYDWKVLGLHHRNMEDKPVLDLDAETENFWGLNTTPCVTPAGENSWDGYYGEKEFNKVCSGGRGFDIGKSGITGLDLTLTLTEKDNSETGQCVDDDGDDDGFDDSGNRGLNTDQTPLTNHEKDDDDNNNDDNDDDGADNPKKATGEDEDFPNNDDERDDDKDDTSKHICYNNTIHDDGGDDDGGDDDAGALICDHDDEHDIGNGDDFDADNDDDNDNDDNDDDDDDDLDVRSFLARMDREEQGGSETSSLGAGADEDLYHNPAIDRGYAWIVVLAVFSIHTILIGYQKSGGIFFVEYQRHFASSASVTSVVIGLTEAFFSITAFVVLGFLLKVISVRQSILFGSACFVLGLLGNAAFDRIEYLILTHSLFYGLACGFIYGPSVLIINEYFKERRALATSLATTGASVGGVIFPFLARYLFDNFGFQGGVIMTAGVVMHIFIGATLLIPIKHHVKRRDIGSEERATALALNGKFRNRDAEKHDGSSILDTLKQRWTSRGSVVTISVSQQGKDNASLHRSNSSIHAQKSQPHPYLQTVVPQLGSGGSGGGGGSKFPSSGTKNYALDLEQFSSKLEICEEGIPLQIQTDYTTAAAATTTDKNTPEPDGVTTTTNDRKQYPWSANNATSTTATTAANSGRALPFQFSTTASDSTSLISHFEGSVCSSTRQGGSRSRLDYSCSNVNSPLDATGASTAPGGGGGGGGGGSSNLFTMSYLTPSRATLSRSVLFKSSSTLNNTIADMISIEQDCYRYNHHNHHRTAGGLTITADHDGDDNDAHSGNLRQLSAFRKIGSHVSNSPLLRSASFWVLALFFFSATIGVALPQIYLLPLAKERGLTDDQAAFCLSLLNMLDIPGHMLPGLLVNFGLMTVGSVCIVPMAVIGILGQLTVFFVSYEALLSLSLVYGLCMGFYFAMQSLIIIDTLGMENFSSSIGLYYLMMGLAGAVSFPVAGALKDLTGTYCTTYHYLASFELLAVALLLILPAVKRYDVRRGVLKA